MCRIIPYDPTVKDLFEEAELSQREAAAKLGVLPGARQSAFEPGNPPENGMDRTQKRARLFA